jgi:hypothetical protein
MALILKCYTNVPDSSPELTEYIVITESNQAEIEAKKAYYSEPLGYWEEYQEPSQEPNIVNTVQKTFIKFYQNQPDGSKSFVSQIEDLEENQTEIDSLKNQYAAPEYICERELQEIKTDDQGTDYINVIQSVVLY